MGGIFVTYKCNSNCTMCHYPSRASREEMNTNEMVNVIREMSEIGVSGIGFTGGEPLLRDDIFHLIKYAKSFNIPITLNTNGILLRRKDIVENILKCSPTNINISLDSSIAAKHNRLRGGKGLFELTTEGIRALADAIRVNKSNVKITVVTVISEDNYEEIEDIAALAKELGAHRLGIMPLHDYGKGTCMAVKSDKLANMAERIKNISVLPIENSSKYIDSIDNAFSGKPFPVKCNAGYTSIFVDPYGKVTPCLGYVQREEWFFQLNKEQSLAELWHSAKYAEIRKETLRCRTCHLNCQAELNFLWPPFLY